MKRPAFAFATLLSLAACAGGQRNLPPPPPPSAQQLPAQPAPRTPSPAPAATTETPAPATTSGVVRSAQAAVPAARAVRWTSYKQFTFDGTDATVQPGDSAKVADIAAYMARNPTTRLGIDGSDTRDAALAAKRVAAVRTALIGAGVQPARIETGDFAASRLKRDRRVDVLLRTD